MDDETRQAFADLRALINDNHERILNRLASLERDFANVKAWLDLDERVTKLERGEWP